MSPMAGPMPGRIALRSCAPLSIIARPIRACECGPEAPGPASSDGFEPTPGGAGGGTSRPRYWGASAPAAGPPEAGDARSEEAIGAARLTLLEGRSGGGDHVLGAAFGHRARYFGALA